VDFGKKTLIFCDTIEIGKAISRELGVPYIYGQATNRLHEIEENKVVCVSRVADLGVSIKDLQRIVEVDFLFGSRQQELQRTGRLAHRTPRAARHHHDRRRDAEVRQPALGAPGEGVHGQGRGMRFVARLPNLRGRLMVRAMARVG